MARENFLLKPQMTFIEKNHKKNCANCKNSFLWKAAHLSNTYLSIG